MDTNDHTYSERPKRSCTQKEPEQKEKSEYSDSEDDIETPENSHDEDFTLDRPRKLKKKKKKVLKEPKGKKVIRDEIPSYFSVMQAHSALEQRLAGRNDMQSNRFVYDSDEDGELDEVWTKDYDDPEPESLNEITGERPPPEPVKKKKIVIRPWNPQWYQIQH